MFPTSIPTPLAHAGRRERGQGASPSPSPAAPSRSTPRGQRWAPRSRPGHRLLRPPSELVTQLGPSWPLTRPKFLPEGSHLPPISLLAALSLCLWSRRLKAETPVNRGLNPTGIFALALRRGQEAQVRPPAAPRVVPSSPPHPRAPGKPGARDTCRGAEPGARCTVLEAAGPRPDVTGRDRRAPVAKGLDRAVVSEASGFASSW